jgi:hypothetical protein
LIRHQFRLVYSDADRLKICLEARETQPIPEISLTHLKSCSAIEWGQRIVKFGYQQVYADDACVAHPARHSFVLLYNFSILDYKKLSQKMAVMCIKVMEKI